MVLILSLAQCVLNRLLPANWECGCPIHKLLLVVFVGLETWQLCLQSPLISSCSLFPVFWSIRVVTLGIYSQLLSTLCWLIPSFRIQNLPLKGFEWYWRKKHLFWFSFISCSFFLFLKAFFFASKTQIAYIQIPVLLLTNKFHASVSSFVKQRQNIFYLRGLLWELNKYKYWIMLYIWN